MKKKTCIITLTLVLLLISISMASSKIENRNLQVTIGKIKLTYNKKDITDTIEKNYNTPPMIINNRAYIPVRAIGEALGTNVNWDSKNFTVEIKDKTEKDIQTEIAKLNLEKEILKKELESLKEENKNIEKIDIKDLEKTLNNKYSKLKKANLEIELIEYKSNIECIINVLKDKNDFLDLSNSQIEDYIKSILSEMEYYKKDISIKGYIKNQKDKLYSFEKKANGIINIDKKEKVDRRELAQKIERDYEKDFYNIEDISIKIYERKDNEYEFNILIDYDRYITQWQDIDSDNIESIMRSIGREIEDAFGTDNIVGLIKNEYNDRENLAFYDYFTEKFARFR